MTPAVRRGLLRTAIVLASFMAVSAFIAATHRSLEAFLRWVDWLSAAPGLSGLVLLLLSPFALLALLFVVHWAYAPFAGEAPRDSAC